MNFDQVLELVKTVSDSDLTSFQYEEGNQRITMQAGGVLFGAGMNGQESGAAFDRTYEKNTGEDVILQGTKAETEHTAAGKSSMGKSLPEATSAAEPAGEVVTSPLVGRFYAAPSEESENFVKIGDSVAKGQVLAIVEAMKLMNEIESDYDGTVTEILVENGQGVEYGQPLFRIAK